MVKNGPILLESIHEIVVTVMYTAAVADAVPVSLVLIAESGTAKSKLIKSICGSSIHKTDSFSSSGLFDLMANDKKNELRWIAVPDLNPTLSRRPSTVNATVANLLTLTMDGTCRTDDGRAEKTNAHNPIGLLSSMTPEMFSRQGRKWFALGLSRRIIPIFYEYSPATLRELQKAVRDDKISGGDFPDILIDVSEKRNPRIDENEALQIEAYGTLFAGNLGLSRGKDKDGGNKWFIKRIVPISPTVVLRTLAKAHAIKNDRNKVGDKDIEFVAKFVDFTNVSRPMMI